MKEKLSFSERRDIALNAGISAIPYLGGALSALYFGAKQERRFKRIETFYTNLGDSVKDLKESLVDLDKLDKVKLAVIIEEINESIEMDFAEERLKYFQNCFINTITSSNQNYEKQRFFISVLSKLTDLDIDILQTLYNAPKDHGLSYIDDTEEDAIEYNASLERLKSYGLLNSRLNGKLEANISWGKITLYTLSQFGKDFVNYCLNTYVEK